MYGYTVSPAHPKSGEEPKANSMAHETVGENT